METECSLVVIHALEFILLVEDYLDTVTLRYQSTISYLLVSLDECQMQHTYGILDVSYKTS